MASRATRIVLVLLAVVSVGSLARMVYVEREKSQLTTAVQEAQTLVQQLTQERTQLTTDLASAKQTIEQQASQNTNLQQESVQAKLDQSTKQVASLQKEKQQMTQQNAKLTGELETALVEKQQLEAKLSNIKELKLAIKDVRRQVWAKRMSNWRARADKFREADRERLAQGNRGFIVRDGQTTIGSSPRLHVHVLEPQAE
jgi:septal ring factor EnvC (AmiA/AmiB activator)